MSIQTQSRPNHVNLAHLGLVAIAGAAIAIAAIVPFSRQEPSARVETGFAASRGTVALSSEQLFQREMNEHEALTTAAFGELQVSAESLAATAIAEHGNYFPSESPSLARTPEVDRALAEHWALIEPYVS